MRSYRQSCVVVLVVALFASPAALQEKGGEDETGPYDVVEKWPSPWARPGYIWGSQPGVFAESPNRIFIAARGELKLPETLPRTFNGIWGSLNQRTRFLRALGSVKELASERAMMSPAKRGTERFSTVGLPRRSG